MKTISILFLSLNKVFCYSNNFQRIKVTSDSLVSYPLDTPRLARPSINHFSSLIDCTAQCNTKTGCDMFAFENSQDCLIGQGFDGNLIMDEDDGVPVYLRDPNVDGYWENTWTAWGQCSATLGPGVHSRTNTCIPPLFKGKPCDPNGEQVETEKCYDPSVLMVFGGLDQNGTPLDTTEVIILDNDDGLSCDPVSVFPPGPMYIGFFGKNGGVPVLCNGLIDGNAAYTHSPGGECWTYNFFVDSTWEDKTSQFNMPGWSKNIISVQINDNDFAILGGVDAYMALYLSGSFVSSSLPKDLGGFCGFMIDEANIMIAGGVDHDNTNAHTDQVYVFDITDINGGWRSVATLPTARTESTCGVITHQNGVKEAVIAAGRGPVGMLMEVLILSLTDFSFRNGPPMPVPLRKSMAQAFGTTFITVTGSNTDTNTYNEIYEFDVENEAWIERVEKTFTGRLGHMVMLSLPNEVVPCYG